jgi:hypothetical protein
MTIRLATTTRPSTRWVRFPFVIAQPAAAIRSVQIFVREIVGENEPRIKAAGIELEREIPICPAMLEVTVSACDRSLTKLHGGSLSGESAGVGPGGGIHAERCVLQTRQQQPLL